MKDDENTPMQVAIFISFGKYKDEKNPKNFQKAKRSELPFIERSENTQGLRSKQLK